MLNKNILITGTSGYLGKEITLTLKAAGATVISFSGDLTNKDSISDCITTILKEFTMIDVFIHCAAAPIVRKKIKDLTPDEFSHQFKVGVVGFFNIYKLLLHHFSGDAEIIAITTQAIYEKSLKIEEDNKGSYLLAKKSLSESLREISASGEIRVNAVAPAFMPGGLNGDIPPEVRDFILSKLPKEEITNPTEVAQVVLDIINKPEVYKNCKVVFVPSLQIKDL